MSYPFKKIDSYLGQFGAMHFEAFLARRIPWLAIAEVNREVLESWLGNVSTVADVLEADRKARDLARAVVDRLAQAPANRAG